MESERFFGSSKESPIRPQFTGALAESNQRVDDFYEAAIAAGARDNISPRARVGSYPGYYAADVFDPDGYSFEVVHKS
jgi:predicted lactoylglutathione lyase